MKNNSYLPISLVVGAIFVLAASYITHNIAFIGLSNTAAAVKSSKATLTDIQASQAQIIAGRIDLLQADISKTGMVNVKSALPTDKTKKNSALIQKVKERKELMMQLMKLSPRLFNAVALKKAERAQLSASLQNDVEQKTTIVGTTEVIHADDFKNPKNSYYIYRLRTPSQTYALYPTSELAMSSGKTVQVTGYVLDSQISIDTEVDPVKLVNQPGRKVSSVASTPDSVGDQKLLVFLLKDSPGATEPVSRQTAQGMIFNGNMQKFMREQSYNQTSFSGDVYGWEVFPQEASFCTMPDSNVLGTYVSAHGINLADYARVVFVSKDAGGGCSDVGKNQSIVNGQTYNFSRAVVGFSGYNSSQGNSFPWTYFDYVLSHELGHSLGVLHANGFDCDTEVSSANCVHIEYGNYFDTMGQGMFSLDFNAFYKELLGWVPQSRILTISQTGTYTINTLEQNTGIVAAKINTADSAEAPYYIELRKATGFDAALGTTVWGHSLVLNQQGLMVNMINHDQPSFPFPRLLDMHPTTLPWGEDLAEGATLNITADGQSQVYNDPRHGIVIGPVMDIGSSSATFKVAINPVSCVPKAPIISQVTWSTTAANGYGNANFAITNYDYAVCGSSTFHTDVLLPAGWTLSQPPEDVQLEPDKRAFEYISYAPPHTGPGIYEVGLTVTNMRTGLKTTYTDHVLVLPALAITDLNPTFGLAGTHVVITGTGFDPYNNTIGLYGDSGYNYTPNVGSSNGTQISYTIPQTITSCGTLGCLDKSIPDGDYTLSIYSGGASATADFTVGSTPSVKSSVALVGSSTLAMVYDPSGAENMLVGTFKVRVTAGSRDQRIDKNNAFYLYLRTDTGFSIGGAEEYVQPASTTDDGNGFYVLPAGTSVIFTVKLSSNPRIMFSGEYYAVLEQVRLGDYSEVKYLSVPPPNTTNKVTIIGEVSPYINSISPNPVPSNQQVTLDGVRFAGSGNVLTLTSNTNSYTQNVASTDSGKTIRFIPNVPEEFYYVQVTSPTTGASNGIGLTVTPSVLPDLTITDITADQYYVRVSYTNKGGSGTGDFLVKVSTDKGSFGGNTLYRFAVPTSGQMAQTGGFTLGLLGLKAGDTANITATIDWESRVPESDETNNTFSKTLKIPGGPPPLPSAPANLTASNGGPGNNSIILTWSPVSGATSYNLYRGASASSLTLANKGYTTTVATDTTVSEGTIYYYAVTAVTSAGESALSTSTSIKAANCSYALSQTATSTQALSSTGSFTVTITGGTGCSFTTTTTGGFITITEGGTGSSNPWGGSTPIKLTYTVTSNSSPARTGKINVLGTNTVYGTNSFPFKVSQAAAIPTYYLQVSVSASGATAFGTVTSVPAGINAPTVSSASYASGTVVTLTATPNAGYVFSNWSGCDSSSSNICTVTVNSLKTVAAIFVSVPPSIPAAPSNMVSTAISSSQINFTWTDNATNETSYKLERSLNGTTWVTANSALGPNTPGYSDSGLAANTKYYHRVRAVNAAGDSAPSNTVTTWTLSASAPPSAPASASSSPRSSIRER